jgi:chromate transporter
MERMVGNVAAIFWIFLRLGCTSFGGPVAHLGYFEREFVEKRRWITAGEYAELIALCHFLPGPASSQVGMALGYRQQGILGSLAAFAGFTLPSALIMMLCASLLLSEPSGWLLGLFHGLKLLAVVVVTDAVVNMSKSVATTRFRRVFLLGSFILMLLLSGALAQLAGLCIAGFIGYLFLASEPVRAGFMRHSSAVSQEQPSVFKSRHVWLLYVLLAGIVIFPLMSYGLPQLAWMESFFRVGATVMGGGHVVLPMLSAESSIAGAMEPSIFLAGYSLAQAVPGPMFTFASYLGVMVGGSIWAGIVATLLIFMPGWIILLLVLPVWQKIRDSVILNAAVAGIQVGVVGLLMATLYKFVWAGAISGFVDVAIVFALWCIIVVFKWPILIGVIAAGLFGLATVLCVWLN